METIPSAGAGKSCRSDCKVIHRGEIWLFIPFFFMKFPTKINKHLWVLLTTNSQHVTVFSGVFAFIFPLLWLKSSDNWRTWGERDRSVLFVTGGLAVWQIFLLGQTRKVFSFIASFYIISVIMFCSVHHNSLFRHLNWPLMTINNWTTITENCTNLS